MTNDFRPSRTSEMAVAMCNAEDVVPRQSPPDRDMRCPTCGVRTEPYGGFGPAPAWGNVGKYRCTACDHVWYADPGTGQLYVRTRRNIRPAGSGPR